MSNDISHRKNFSSITRINLTPLRNDSTLRLTDRVYTDRMTPRPLESSITIDYHSHSLSPDPYGISAKHTLATKKNMTIKLNPLDESTRSSNPSNTIEQELVEKISNFFDPVQITEVLNEIPSIKMKVRLLDLINQRREEISQLAANLKFQKYKPLFQRYRDNFKQRQNSTRFKSYALPRDRPRSSISSPNSAANLKKTSLFHDMMEIQTAQRVHRMSLFGSLAATGKDTPPTSSPNKSANRANSPVFDFADIQQKLANMRETSGIKSPERISSKTNSPHVEFADQRSPVDSKKLEKRGSMREVTGNKKLERRGTIKESTGKGKPKLSQLPESLKALLLKKNDNWYENAKQKALDFAKEQETKRKRKMASLANSHPFTGENISVASKLFEKDLYHFLKKNAEKETAKELILSPKTTAKGQIGSIEERAAKRFRRYQKEKGKNLPSPKLSSSESCGTLPKVSSERHFTITSLDNKSPKYGTIILNNIIQQEIALQDR